MICSWVDNWIQAYTDYFWIVYSWCAKHYTRVSLNKRAFHYGRWHMATQQRSLTVMMTLQLLLTATTDSPPCPIEWRKLTCVCVDAPLNTNKINDRIRLNFAPLSIASRICYIIINFTTQNCNWNVSSSCTRFRAELVCFAVELYTSN